MKITKQNAVKLIAKTIIAHSATIPGLKAHHLEQLRAQEQGTSINDDHISAEWERAWSVGADLSVSIQRNSEREDKATGQRFKTYTSTVRVSWSSSGRTPAMAVAAANIAQRVAELACLVEAQLGELEIEEVRS